MIKEVLRSAAMAFTMFSVLPMPQVEWKKENMRYMLALLPLVGVVITLAMLVWLAAAELLRLGNILFAVGLTVLPVLLSGGIHLDGFCDTVDALSSHALPERKREILHDSNAGAFAVIFGALYFLLYAGLCTEVPRTAAAVLSLGLQQVLARAVGAFASVVFPGSGSTGMLSTFRDASAKRAAVILAVWMAACAVGLLVLSPAGGAAALIASAGCLLYLKRMSRREFGGMSGDLAGYLITLSGLLTLAGYVFAERAALQWF